MAVLKKKSNLIVPVVLWGKTPPKHRICCMRPLFDSKTIVTGSLDGELIVWELINSVLSAKLMLLGHVASITSISPTTLANSPTSTRFLSTSSDGRIILWDSADGRCADSVVTNQIHRQIFPYCICSGQYHACRLYCIGDYSEIVVLHPKDLEVVLKLGTKVEPDWISALTFVRTHHSSDAVIGITVSGMAKVWRIVDIDKRDHSLPIYEQESRNIGVCGALSISWSSANPSIFLLVAEHSFQIFSVTELSRLCVIDSCERLCDGALVYKGMLAVATSDGSMKLYMFSQTPKAANSSQECIVVDTSAPIIYTTTERNSRSNGKVLNGFSFCFHFNENEISFTIYVANLDGTITAWNVPSSLLADDEKENRQVNYREPLFENSLGDLWKKLDCKPPSLFESEGKRKVTAVLYVSLQGRLVLGCDEGSILVMYACEALSKTLLGTSTESGCRVLSGHHSSVSCLIFPHEEDPRYDRQILVSGSTDFSVIAWNINNGARLFRFCVQGGPVLRLLVPPDNCNGRILHTICSIAGDNSAALLSLKENKCLLLASCQVFPIIEVKWRPLDDFMLLKCEDDTVYVWQMDTANLERVVTGVVAEEILAACDEQIGVIEGEDEAGASQAVQMLRAFRNKNISAVRQIASGTQDDKVPTMMDAEENLPSPVIIKPLTKYIDSSHLVLFSIDSLITGLHSIEEETTLSEAECKSLSTIIKNKPTERRPRALWQTDSNLYFDFAKLCLSLLHAWTLDSDLDAICLKKLQLWKPKLPLNFGLVSSQGFMSVFFPTVSQNSCSDTNFDLFEKFSSSHRWSLSSSLCTVHLLAVMSLASTLMMFRDNSVDRNKKTAATRQFSKASESEIFEEENQVKQGWLLLGATHCCLLPDLVKSKCVYFPPRIELLTKRWQDQCLAVRSAAQSLLMKELNRLGMKGRKRLMESWAPFLPILLDPSLSIFGSRTVVASMNLASPSNVSQPPPIPPRSGNMSLPESSLNIEAKLEEETGLQQIRRNQATALIIFSVIGSEYPDQLNQLELTRATSLSLLELLIAPPSTLLPLHSPLRRAAIDLIGRGFCVWQPHIDISKVLLQLLDLATISDQPNVHKCVFSDPATDSCRTARQALTRIALARPPVIITALSKEVARYNSTTQHQTIQLTSASPLLRTRTEVLRIIEQLCEQKYSDVTDLILPVGEILVHCLDVSLLKQKTLSEIFPPITKFYIVSYSASTRRIAFGSRNGSVVVHELRTSKAQTIQAHNAAVTAVSFTDDGKYLATYGAEEGKISFWQTSQSFLGMGHSQLRCLRTQTAPSIFPVLSAKGAPQPFKARLVWIGSKSLTLMLPNGKEHRFSL